MFGVSHSTHTHTHAYIAYTYCIQKYILNYLKHQNDLDCLCNPHPVCVSTMQYRGMFDPPIRTVCSVSVKNKCLLVCDFALDRGMDERRETERQKERWPVNKPMSKLFTKDTVNGYCVHA